MTAMPSSHLTEAALMETVKQAGGYVTVPYLAEVTGTSPEAVEKFVASHPREIRKSIMHMSDGKPLLRYNSPLSGLADLWATFRYINYLKH